MSHHVTCYESNLYARSYIYDPNGNSLTNEDLCNLINELQDDNLRLKNLLGSIVEYRNEFEGPSLDYMQGYRDGQQSLQELAKLGMDVKT